jgi:hypothetical protein
VPTLPPQDLIVAFQKRFKDGKALVRGLEATVDATDFLEIIDARLHSSRNKSSRNALNIAVIPQEALITMLTSLSRFGLSRFYPNVFENAYTPYNQAHRAAATAVFREAITSKALDNFGVETSCANMFSLHNDLYNHIVFFTLKGEAAKEERHPGQVVAEKERSKAYDRRKKVMP